jgi:hypothetical protein
MSLGCRGACIAACLLLASLAPCCAEPTPIIHYAPAETLSTIDQSAKARMESGAGLRGRTALPLNQKRSNNWVYQSRNLPIGKILITIGWGDDSQAA